MAIGIGAAMAGGKRGNKEQLPRQEDDWYPTPEDLTSVLFDLVQFDGSIYEPCCGDGALAKVASDKYGYDVIGTDLVYRGYGVGHGPDYDVLKINKLLGNNVVTNPPFNISAPLIQHLWSLKPAKMAMLLKSTYWHAASRKKIFDRMPPARIIAPTWRPDFMNRKRPTMEVIWCVWEQDFDGKTTYETVSRPAWAKKKNPRKPRKKAEKAVPELKLVA